MNGWGEKYCDKDLLTFVVFFRCGHLSSPVFPLQQGQRKKTAAIPPPVSKTCKRAWRSSFNMSVQIFSSEWIVFEHHHLILSLCSCCPAQLWPRRRAFPEEPRDELPQSHLHQRVCRWPLRQSAGREMAPAQSFILLLPFILFLVVFISTQQSDLHPLVRLQPESQKSSHWFSQSFDDYTKPMV